MGNRNKALNSSVKKYFILCIVLGLVISCLPSSNTKIRSRVNASATAGSAAVGIGQGRVLKDNPIILSNNFSLSIDSDLNRFLGSAVTITNNPFLQANPNCFGLTTCFEVRNSRESVSALQTTDGKWSFRASSDEFLQVNTFYHINKIFDQFYANLSLNLASAYDEFTMLPIYDTAIPKSLRQTDGTFKLNSQMLLAFANCDVADNAYYDQATESLCFGYTGAKKELRWAHDSTIIYHETGHFMQKLQLNFRNNEIIKAQMSNNLNNEAGAIGEGLSDFYSYYTNGRTHWGEWAAGHLNGSRPLSEDDHIHAPGISKDDDGRLSYPQYLTYDPNYPTEPIEDIHMSGMIISHYLVALTQDLELKCSMTNLAAREYVMTFISETLAELGDLTSKGTEQYGREGKVNLNPISSYLWFTTVNPITYRSFTQTIAKNILNTLGNPNLNRCNGNTYSKDNIEALLDSYGLLLFKTYNEHRNFVGKPIMPLESAIFKNTAVTNSNRKKSVLIKKSNLILDPSTGASSAYVIDNKEQIAAGISQLQTAGIIGTLSTQTPSDLGFNNNNSKVSPGEVVAIAINLYNNSNSTMGGIDILANDWDHADPALNRPCQFGPDLWPLESEGGSKSDKCNQIGTMPGVNSTKDAVATTGDFVPVCFVQYNDSNSTTWISQSEFKSKVAVSNNLCLDKNNDKDCFIRAIKGADKAHYSKLNPKSTWGQTMANPKTGAAYSLDWGNIILFEVSKNTPPGTVVNCRLRARFTNCEDCFHDDASANNDFLDEEYNGNKPYKIIHRQIPITD